jgi:hypothetical protein
VDNYFITSVKLVHNPTTVIIMFGNDRNQLRKVFYDCWQAKQSGAQLDAMQKMIARIIELHPEYHSLLQNPDALDRDYLPEHGETNPFLHMSMHIALGEQLAIDRPAGILSCYQTLTDKAGSAHEAEHEMMECLAEALWQAQRQQQMPDEAAYLDCIQVRAGLKKKSDKV